MNHFHEFTIELRNRKIRRQTLIELRDALLGAKGGTWISYIGGMFLYYATQSIPGIGTSGQGINFGSSQYYFIVERYPLASKFGLLLMTLGFVLQMVDGTSLKNRLTGVTLSILFFIPVII